MVDVGRVSIGVTVNAAGLGTELARKIREAVEPAIKEVNAQLATMNREINRIDTHKFDTLAHHANDFFVALREINHQLTDMHRNLEKVRSDKFSSLVDHAHRAAAAIALVGIAGKESAHQIEIANAKAIISYNLLGDAAERAAVKQAAAVQHLSAVRTAIALDNKTIAEAERAMREADRGAGGGGGAGGGRGGGYGRGGYQYGHLLHRREAALFTGPVGLNLLALSATAVGPAALGVTKLLQSVEQLSGVVGAMPGIMASMAASLGTAKLGFSGLGDAVKDCAEAVASGDWSKANEDLKNMAPNAQRLVKAMVELAPQFKGIKQLVQENMFAGLDTQITNVVTKLVPTFKGGLDQISKAWNVTFKALLGAVGSDSTKGFLERIFGNTAESQRIVSASIEPFVHAFGTLAAAGSDTIPRLAHAVNDLATRFDNFITAADKSGALAKWINDGETAVANLGHSLLNIGKIIHDITSAAGGRGFLDWLKDATDKLHAFLSSPRGQEDLKKFFADARHQIELWKPILENLATKIIPEVWHAFKQWGDVILPILKKITDFLAGNKDLVKAFLEGFLAIKTFGGLEKLLGFLGGVNKELDKSPEKVGKFGTALSGLKGIISTLGLGLLLDELTKVKDAFDKANKPPTPENLTPANQIGQLPGKTIAEGIGGGAFFGSRFGVPGAIIGGGLGALGTAIAMAHLSDAQRKQIQDAIAAAPDMATKQAIFNQVFGGPAGVAALHPGTFEYQTAEQAITGINTQQRVGLPYFHPEKAGQQQVLDQLIANAKAAITALDQLKSDITTLPDHPGEIIVKNLPEVVQKVKDLGLDVEALQDHPGYVRINTNVDVVKNQIEHFLDWYTAAIAGLPAPGAPPGSPPARTPGEYTPGQTLPGLLLPPSRATGGMILPGYSPGRDNMLWPMSGGEGVIIPEAMRVLGPEWLYRLNSSFRPGISRAGYGMAGGGVTGFNGGGGPFSPPPGDETQAQRDDRQHQEIMDVSTQTRDLLWGKIKGPPQVTADSVAEIAQDTDALQDLGGKGTTDYGKSPGGQDLIPSGQLGPFGTPILKEAGNPTYNLLARELKAFGIDPTMVIGTDPWEVAKQGLAAGLAANPNFLGMSQTGPGSSAGIAQGIKEGLAGLPWNGGIPGDKNPAGAGGVGLSSWMSPGFGGPVQARLVSAISPGNLPDVRGAHPQLAYALAAVQRQFPGLTLTAGMTDHARDAGWHPKGQAIDIGGGTPAMRSAAANWLLQFAPGIEELINSGPGVTQNIKSGKLGPAIDMPGSVYSTGQAGYHGDHIHLAVTDAQAQMFEAMISGGGVGAMGGGFGGGGVIPVYVTNFGGGGSGNPFAGAAGAASGHLANWNAIAGPESGNNWQIAYGQGTPDNPVTGGLQIGDKTWADYGGLQFAPRAYMASPEQQMTIADKVLQGQGPGAWPVTSAQHPDWFQGPGGGGAAPASWSTGGGGGGGDRGGGPGSPTSAGPVIPAYVINWPGQEAQPAPPAGSPTASNTGPGSVFGPKGPFGQIAQAGLGAVGQVGSKVATDILGGISDVGLTPLLQPGTMAAAPASLTQLLHERNPLTLLAMAGFPIPNLAQTGPQFSPGALAAPGPEFNAQGQLFTNTLGLSQRTSTDLAEQINDMKQQVVAATNEVQKQLTQQVLEPVLAAGVTSGMNALSQTVLSQWGSAMGAAASGPIASAVSAATQAASASGGSTNPNAAANTIAQAPINAISAVTSAGLFDEGGILPHRAYGINLSGFRERVLSPSETATFTSGAWPVHPVTGLSAIGVLPSGQAIWPVSGATSPGGFGGTGPATNVSGVAASHANAQVGAQFLGLTQVPILGEIINILIAVLLSVLGINIQVANTLQSVSEGFKQFRGSFQEFTAAGQLFNDTAMMMDRSQTSTSEVAQQKIAILEQVISALIQYIINNVIVPLAKALGQAVVQALGSAAGTAINAAIPGGGAGIAGNAAQSFIDALGNASVDIAAQVGQAIADALTQVLTQAISEAFQSYFPGIANGLFGGNPKLGGVLSLPGTILGNVLGGGMGLLATLLGGVLAVIPGVNNFGGGIGGAFLNSLFDEGGIATGAGLLPKATIQPERVLSPSQTSAFERMVTALERGNFSATSNTTVHAPFTVTGGQQGAQVVHDRLLALMN